MSGASLGLTGRIIGSGKIERGGLLAVFLLVLRRCRLGLLPLKKPFFPVKKLKIGCRRRIVLLFRFR
jgi:hypothetical protein